MPGRREELLDAAAAVLADGGPRALTHRAADAAAAAPPGSTSNHFRTRGALLAGVLDHVLAAETAFYGALAGSGDGPVELARDTAAMVEQLVGPMRTLTAARLALGMEAAWDPGLREPYARGRAVWRGVACDRCVRAGVARPEETAEALLALVDGVVAERLRTGPAGEPSAAVVERAVRALLRGAAAAPA